MQHLQYTTKTGPCQVLYEKIKIQIVPNKWIYRQRAAAGHVFPDKMQSFTAVLLLHKGQHCRYTIAKKYMYPEMSENLYFLKKISSARQDPFSFAV